MKQHTFGFLVITVVCLSLSISIFAQASNADTESYLTWNPKQIERIGKQMRKKDKVGSRYTARGLKTSRAINYKLRATLMTAEVIRASARLNQLRNRLSNDQTRELVKEAEAIEELVIMIELDPNEGSGVIPLGWRALLQPVGLMLGAPGVITGKKAQVLRKIEALTGVFRRNYDYDVFFVKFPLIDDECNALLAPTVQTIELIVGINNQEGKVRWSVPGSLRSKIESLTKSAKSTN